MASREEAHIYDMDSKPNINNIMGGVQEGQMTPLLCYAIGLMGLFLLQDGLASIAFYPTEKWKWNHTARAIRASIGLALIIIAGVML